MAIEITHYARWGKIIGQAGAKELSKAELLRLQQEVIENSRFVAMGFRKKGGFVGEHNRITGEPIPEHISAKWQDIERLMKGVVAGLLSANSFGAFGSKNSTFFSKSTPESPPAGNILGVDIQNLTALGVVDSTKLMSVNEIDAFIAAAGIAFGFVFIHPFEDGNGRIHRYIRFYRLERNQRA